MTALRLSAESARGLVAFHYARLEEITDLGDIFAGLTIVSSRPVEEIAARRRIIARYEAAVESMNTLVRAGQDPRRVAPWTVAARATLFVVLREQSTPYAEHPAYRAEWKPPA